MLKHNLVLLMIGCLFNPSLKAASFFYCSSSNNYIYPGATLDEVYQKCGEPISSETKDTTPTEERKVLEFSYYGQQSLLLLSPQARINVSYNVSNRPPFSIYMFDDKVIDIRINDKSVKSSYICRTNREIAVGNSRLEVIQICGTPGSQQTVTQKVPQPSVKEIIAEYQPNPYIAPTRLHFYDNVLVNIEP